MLPSLTWNVCIGLHNGSNDYNDDSSPILITHMVKQLPPRPGSPSIPPCFQLHETMSACLSNTRLQSTPSFLFTSCILFDEQFAWSCVTVLFLVHRWSDGWNGELVKMAEKKLLFDSHIIHGLFFLFFFLNSAILLCKCPYQQAFLI